MRPNPKPDAALRCVSTNDQMIHSNMGHSIFDARQYSNMTHLFLEVNMMSHLTEIDVVEDEDIKSGYTITFIFEKNAFFTNDKIVKKYHMTPEGTVENSTTKIDWKPVS